MAAEPTASENPPPKITSLHWKKGPRAGRTATLIVKGRDPNATVTSVLIEWGDGRGVWADNLCAAFRDGKDGPHTGKTISFVLTHKYVKKGDYSLHARAVSERCPKRTHEQDGPTKKKPVHVRPNE
jgi:hypothetical protein